MGDVDPRPRSGESARSLLLTVLGEFVLPSAGGTVWTAAVVRALGALGVAEKAARQALARTAADGWLAGEKVGRQARFALTPAGRSLLEEGAARIYAFGPREDWDGRWLLLSAVVPEERRAARHHLRTRLAWAGFGSAGAGLWLNPDVAREDEARRLLEAAGPLPQAASFVGRFGAVGDEAGLVASAWDLADLEARYDKFAAEVASARPRRPDEAFECCTRLVHEWRRFPFVDPGLPVSLLPTDWAGTRAAALFRRRRAEWHPPAEAWFAAAGPS